MPVSGARLRLLRSQRANNFSWASAPVEVFLLSGPELLDGSDQVGAVRLPDSLKHPISSVLSELLVESAGEGLFLGFAVLSGLAPLPLADGTWSGIGPPLTKRGGRRCGAWNVAPRPSRSDPSAPPRATAGSA